MPRPMPVASNSCTTVVGAQAQLDVAQTNLKTTSATLEQARASVSQARDQLGYSTA